MDAPKYTINPIKRGGKYLSCILPEPGPGHYENSDNSEGRYAISSLRDTNWALWGHSNTVRFKNPGICFLVFYNFIYMWLDMISVF